MNTKTEETEEELIFAKCKESLEDVGGWKVFIFLPQSFMWRLFIVLTVLFTYILRTFEFFFSLTFSEYNYLELVCNVLYFLDTLCSTLHFLMVKTRKLRHGKKRPFLLLLVDYLSLIPFETVDDFFIYVDTTNFITRALRQLRINVCLRTYQFYIFFSETRYWIYKMKIYCLITFLAILVGLFLVNHLLCCIYFYFLEETDKETCLKYPLICIIETELLIYSLLSESYMDVSYTRSIENYSFIIATYFLIGYFLTYGILLPFLYFGVYNFLLNFNEFFNRQDQLNLLINNLTNDKTIAQKIVQYFQTIWKYGKGSKKPDVIKVFPICMQKSIFCDVHWDAFKHSQLLSFLTMGCKRTISLHMKKDFILPDIVLLNRDQIKESFMYLESGVIQIMAEENDKSPVIAFSGGTILGEMTLFHKLKSKAILKTATLCVIHLLAGEDLMRILLDYPKDKRKLFEMMRYRMKVARATHQRQTKILPYFAENQVSFLQEKGNIKWMKQQFRSVVEIQKSMKDKFFSKQVPLLNTRMDHTSLFLSLMVINDVMVNRHQSVCVTTRLPWYLDPTSSFVKIWNKIVIFFSFVASILYPFFIGWYPTLPQWFFNFSIFTTFIYTIDVIVTLVTAIKDKDSFIVKFGVVFNKRLRTINFYLDVLAALPIQIFYCFRSDSDNPYTLNLCLFNAFLKSYKMISYLWEWNYRKSGSPLIRTVIKNLFFLAISIYWMSMLFKLAGVECVFYDCGENDWFYHFQKEFAEENLRDWASFYLSFFLGLDLADDIFQTDLFVSYFMYLLFYVYFRMLFLFLVAEILSVRILQTAATLNFQKLIELVQYFLQSRQISGRILNRVNDTLMFQWYYDRGNYITQENRLVDDIPLHLRDELDKHSLFSTIHSCPLFKEENESFVKDLCRRSRRMALPANSVLLTFSVQTMCIYIVHKGFAQINSFLPNDIVSNVGKPKILRSGETFPIMIAFHQIPSIITARTVTDCELIVLKMEDVLAVFFVHGVLKDVVESLKKADLKPLAQARPGLSIVQDVHHHERIEISKYGKLAAIHRFFGFFLYRKTINAYSRRFMQWEVFRVASITLSLFVWPFIYGFLLTSPFWRKFLTYMLLTVETTTWFDLYVRTRIAYYNNKGIYVSHPISTIIHYLTSSFIVDVLAFVPYFHIIYLIFKKQDSYNLKTCLIHTALRCCGFYRIFGFFHYIGTSNRLIYQVEFIKYLIFGIIVLNTYVNLMVLQRLTGGEMVGPVVAEKSTAFFYYFSYLMVAFRILAKIDFYLEDIEMKEIIFIGIIYICRIIFEVANYSFLMINYMGSAKRLTHYQYNLRSFLKFLNEERIDEKHVKEVVDYYEYVWSQLKGINFNRLFSKFPDILHEDILIAVYKSTLTSVECLSKANEAFYRIISRNFDEIYMEKGSIIIFEGQVKPFIYFVHKGQCEVKKKSIVLCKGSVIGDIKGGGTMKNTIAAKTHIILLKIPSMIFFEEMNNFSETKKEFEKEVAEHEDYMKSAVEELIEEDAEKILPQKRASEIPESEFEPITSKESAKGEKTTDGDIIKATENAEAKGIFHPASGKSKFLKIVFFTDALLTVLLVPAFVGVHLVSFTTMAITYAMDIIWMIKIGVTLRTAITNPKTGILSYNKKAIFRHYLNKLDGFVTDVVSVLPIELVPFTMNKVTKSTLCFHYYFSLRSLRFFYILRIINKNKQKLTINSYFRWGFTFLKEISIINLFVSLVLMVSIKKELKHDTCYHKVYDAHWSNIIMGYLCVVNIYSGGNSVICKPENNLQIMIDTIIAIWGCFAKASLFAQAAIIIFRVKGTKFETIKKLEELENYLVVRNISPALLGGVKRYFINLVDYCREGGMPIFLKEAPDFIKFHVMGELYVHHLSNCRLFQGVSEIFINQLATRLERFVFFPGNYIVKQGDVDQNMYFIHRGEVYCLEKDKEYESLERPVDLFVKNESFGLMQGLFTFYSHPYSYRAKTLSEILVLNFNVWEDMRQVNPHATKLIYEKALQAESAKETHLSTAVD